MDTNPLSGVPYTPRFYTLLEKRQRLPSWSAREEFLKTMQGSQVVAVVGEAGTGKTTQIPQILLDAGYHVQNGAIKALACVQPHNAAAMSAAARIAEELEVQVGSFVGYHTAFEDKTGKDTLLRMTSAEALLQEMLTDPTLEKYSVVLIDEVQERALETDVVLSLMKGVLQKRPELKLVLMSPTDSISRIQKHFGGCPLLKVPIKTSPVDIYHTSRAEKDYCQAAVRTVVQIWKEEKDPGDILVFLATEEEVEQACIQLRKEAVSPREIERSGELMVVPMHENLSLAEHQKAFAPSPGPKGEKGKPGRKAVIATSIAESSLAVDNIVFVVDSGFSRQRVHNPRIRLDCHLVSAVSKPTAAVRAAAASRAKCTGKCFRLYSESAFKDLPEYGVPEMLRSGLSGVVLTLKSLGVEDLVKFDWPDPPSPESLMRAIETLHYLGCLDESGALTEVGRQAAHFPLAPELARMLVSAPTHRCCNEALSIAATLSVGPVFLRPSGSHKAADEAKARFVHADGDHLTLLNAFHAFKGQVQSGVVAEKFCSEQFLNLRALQAAEGVRETLRLTMESLGLQMVSTEFTDKEYYPNIRRCLLSGFFMNVAHLENEKEGKYLMVRDGQEVALHPSCCFKDKPEWVVADRFVLTSRNFLRVATKVDGQWVLDSAPGYFDVARLPKSEAREKLEKMSAEKAS